MRSKKKVLLILIVLLALGMMGTVILVGFIGPLQSSRVGDTQRSLDVARESVRWFKERTGRLPVSLAQISEYASQTNVDYYRPGISAGKIELFLPALHKEHISSFRGDSNEHRELNDQGGFYYNNQTGDVKINLTRPLKTYFIVYFSLRGDEIPSSW